MREMEGSFPEQLGREHASLLRQLGDLENSLAENTVGTVGGLAEALRRLRTVLHRHFLFEEKGGYMSHVLEQSPHLHRRTEELLADHHCLGRNLEDLIGSAAVAVPGSPIPAQLAADVRQWIQQVRDHESRENQFVLEAWNQDESVED